VTLLKEVINAIEVVLNWKTVINTLTSLVGYLAHLQEMNSHAFAVDKSK
jgi:hypothetical protein